MSRRPVLSLRLAPKPPHVIAINREPFGQGFDVTVSPAPGGVGHDRELPTHAAAAAYAERLAAATGWPIRDLTIAEAANSGAPQT